MQKTKDESEQDRIEAVARRSLWLAKATNDRKSRKIARDSVLPTSGPVQLLALEMVFGVPVVWGMGRRVVS